MLLINESVEYSSTINYEYNLNLNWIKRNYENLLIYYKDKYVAVKDEMVIDSDQVLQKLLRRIEYDYDSIWNSITIQPINNKHKIF